VNSSQHNILIVENSTPILALIKESFKNSAYTLYFAQNIDKAKEIITSNSIGYLILNDSITSPIQKDYPSFFEDVTIKTFIITSAQADMKALFYTKGVVDYLDRTTHFEFQINQLPHMVEQTQNNKDRTILIVEEKLQTQKELRTVFENRNYNVITKQYSKEILTLASLEKIDLILLNIDNEKNILDFILQHKKELIDTLNISILFMGYTISATVLRDALKIGICGFVNKPYAIEELILKVDMWINNKIKSEELISSTSLLQQYKNTVDRSSIVSKTNPKGIITYVNDSFCAISGYTPDELIGKPHNIVRHPDMEASVFKQMWKTIKEEKKTWLGEVKNRAKDGSTYWVQTIINPILDANGNILEYIGIRNDITDLEKTKEYLQKQFNITKDNFAEIMTLTKLYEEAMNKSNIVLRIDKNKTIAYANDQFYTLMGYSKKELIGKPYSYINRPTDIKSDEFSNIDKVLEQVNTKGVWKGKLRNISKKGKIFHFILTILPIKNAKGEILEYMGIRQDITEVVELHEELEATQREIVYKMGEIGETRSKETGNHVKRVAEYSKLLAELYGLSAKESDILFTASPMHDIGKVGIPDAILNKPGPLDAKEWKIMKTHSVIGYNILKTSKREVLKAAAIVSREHHEKWDGSGYPRGLKGEKIHIFGRITAVADVFDALGSDRCYKKAWEDERIFKLLLEEKEKHFDPVLIELFMTHIEKFKTIRDKYKD